MEFHSIHDWPLEGDDSLMWFLTELVSGHEGPVARHYTWVSSSGIPAGDRSVHEHFLISKVLEYGAEIDQLNLPTLLSFETLGRRLQLIEHAHTFNPSNPDYTGAEDFMGWGPQRGAALVAPSLRKAVAEKAKERADIMKELRKQNEEIRLRKPAPKKGAQQGDGKGGAKEAPAP